MRNDGPSNIDMVFAIIQTLTSLAMFCKIALFDEEESLGGS